MLPRSRSDDVLGGQSLPTAQCAATRATSQLHIDLGCQLTHAKRDRTRISFAGETPGPPRSRIPFLATHGWQVQAPVALGVLAAIRFLSAGGGIHHLSRSSISKLDPI